MSAPKSLPVIESLRSVSDGCRVKSRLQLYTERHQAANMIEELFEALQNARDTLKAFQIDHPDKRYAGAVDDVDKALEKVRGGK